MILLHICLVQISLLNIRLETNLGVVFKCLTVPCISDFSLFCPLDLKADGRGSYVTYLERGKVRSGKMYCAKFFLRYHMDIICTCRHLQDTICSQLEKNSVNLLKGEVAKKIKNPITLAVQCYTSLRCHVSGVVRGKSLLTLADIKITSSRTKRGNVLAVSVPLCL